MDKPAVDNRNHFKKQSEIYRQVVESTNKEIYKNVRIELDKNLNGVVLDIGNGNVFAYDVNRLEKVIALDLAFTDDIQDSEKIKHIIGNAVDLRKIDSESFDCVLMQFVIHHIIGKTRKDTDKLVLASLNEAWRVLKRKGKLIIAEMLVHPILEPVENIFYGITSRFLGLLDRPMVKFYSKKSLVSKLYTTNFNQVSFKQIYMSKWSNWYDPLSFIFPGVIKIPGFLFPTKPVVIIALK